MCPFSSFHIKPNKRFPLFLLCSIVVLGAFLRCYRLGYESMWIDEIACVNLAKASVRDQVVYTLYTPRSIHLHPPLYTIVLHFFLYLGDNEFIARLPSAIFGVLAILLVFKVGRLLFGLKEGLICAFLLSASPFHIYLSQETVMYSQFMFLSLLSVFFFCKAITEENDTKSWIGFVVSTLLGIYTHFYMFYIILIEIPFLIHLLYKKRASIMMGLPKLSKKSILFLVRTLIISIFLLPILQMASNVVKQGSFGREYGWPPESITKALFSHFSGSDFGILLFIPVFLIGLIASIRKHRRSAVLLLLWVFLPTTIVLILSLSFGPSAYVTTRIMVFILPGYLTGVSRGIGTIANIPLSRLSHSLARPSKTKEIALSLLIAVVFFGGISVSSIDRIYRQENADWRSVAEYLKMNAHQGEIVVMTQQHDTHMCFSYYYHESDARAQNITVAFPRAETLLSSNLSIVDVGIWFVTPDPPRVSSGYLGDQTATALYIEQLGKWVTANHLAIVKRCTKIVILYRPAPAR